MKELILRKADDFDMKDIMELLTQVFAGEQRIPADMIPLPEALCPEWWCALKGTSIVGAVCAWKENGRTHWGRFAVNPASRGLHVGTQLAEYSLRDLFSQGITEIHMEARDVTVMIISRLGGRITGTPVEFYEGSVTPMILYKTDFSDKC